MVRGRDGGGLVTQVEGERGGERWRERRMKRCKDVRDQKQERSNKLGYTPIQAHKRT